MIKKTSAAIILAKEAATLHVEALEEFLKEDQKPLETPESLKGDADPCESPTSITYNGDAADLTCYMNIGPQIFTHEGWNMTKDGSTKKDCAFTYTIAYTGTNLEGCSGYVESTKSFYCGVGTADGDKTIATITVKSPTGVSFGDLANQTFAMPITFLDGPKQDPAEDCMPPVSLTNTDSTAQVYVYQNGPDVYSTNMGAYGFETSPEGCYYYGTEALLGVNDDAAI